MEEEEQQVIKPNKGKTRIRLMPEREMSPSKLAIVFPKYPPPKRELYIPVPQEPVFNPVPEPMPLRYVPRKEKKKPIRKTAQGQIKGQENKIKSEASSKPKRRYLRRRMAVNRFNRGNRLTEFGDKFKNYFSYLYLLAMQDFSAVLDKFQDNKDWTFARFQQIASKHKIVHVFNTTTNVMTNENFMIKLKEKSTKKDNMTKMEKRFRMFTTRVILDAVRELWLSNINCENIHTTENLIIKRRLGAFFLLYYLYNCQPNFPKEKIPCIDEDIKAIEIFTKLIKLKEYELNDDVKMETGGKIDLTSEYGFILFNLKSERSFNYGASRFKYEMQADMINLHHDQNTFRTTNSILRKEASIYCREIKNHLFKKSQLDRLYLVNYLDIRRKLSAQEKLEKLTDNDNQSSSSYSPTKSPPKKRPRIFYDNDSLTSTASKLINFDTTVTTTDPLVSEYQKVLEEVSFFDQLQDTYQKIKSISEKDYFDLRYTMGNYLGDRYFKEELQALAHRKIKAKQYYETRKKKIEAARIASKRKKFLLCTDIVTIRRHNFIKGLPGSSNKNFLKYQTTSNLEYAVTLIPPSYQNQNNQSTSSTTSSIEDQFNRFKALLQSKKSYNSNSADNFRKLNNTKSKSRSKSTFFTKSSKSSKSSNIHPAFRSNKSITTTTDNNSRKPSIQPKSRSKSAFVANNPKSSNISSSFQSNATTATTTTTTTTATATTVNLSDDDFNLDNITTTTTSNPYQFTSTSIDYLSQSIPSSMNLQSATTTTTVHYPYYSTTIPSLTNTNSNYFDHFNGTTSFDPFESISTSQYTGTLSTSSGPTNLNTLVPFDSNTSTFITHHHDTMPMSPIPVETETTSTINNVNSIMFEDYLNNEIIIDDLQNNEEIEIQLN